jgi:hypothetical protein
MMPQKRLPPPDWGKIFALDHTTEKGKMFHILVAAGGNWVHGKSLCDYGCGYDFRTRGARLRDIGVPVYSRSVPYSNVHEYRIEPWFFTAWAVAKEAVA